jgi:hypothetical protein
MMLAPGDGRQPRVIFAACKMSAGSFGDGMAVLPRSAMWHHRT